MSIYITESEGLLYLDDWLPALSWVSVSLIESIMGAFSRLRAGLPCRDLAQASPRETSFPRAFAILLLFYHNHSDLKKQSSLWGMHCPHMQGRHTQTNNILQKAPREGYKEGESNSGEGVAPFFPDGQGAAEEVTEIR